MKTRSTIGGVLLILGSACSPNSSVTQERLPEPDTSVSCEAPAEVVINAGLAYPPTHPEAESVSPEHCMRSLAQAKSAGFALAPPPQGSILVAGIYLQRSDSLEKLCRRIGSRSKLKIRCPRLLPAGLFVNCLRPCVIDRTPVMSPPLMRVDPFGSPPSKP
jgi:hypothetical protein